MNSSNILARQSHRLLQIDVALFLFTSFEGFAIPYFASPIVGRSVHTLSALFGLILLAFGLLWPRLRLGTAPSRISFWFLVYSGLAITAAFFLAATWGAGQSLMPLSGAPRGTPFRRLPSRRCRTPPRRRESSRSRSSCGAFARHRTELRRTLDE